MIYAPFRRGDIGKETVVPCYKCGTKLLLDGVGENSYVFVCPACVTESYRVLVRKIIDEKYGSPAKTVFYESYQDNPQIFRDCLREYKIGWDKFFNGGELHRQKEEKEMTGKEKASLRRSYGSGAVYFTATEVESDEPVTVVIDISGIPHLYEYERGNLVPFVLRDIDEPEKPEA